MQQNAGRLPLFILLVVAIMSSTLGISTGGSPTHRQAETPTTLPPPVHPVTPLHPTPPTTRPHHQAPTPTDIASVDWHSVAFPGSVCGYSVDFTMPSGSYLLDGTPNGNSGAILVSVTTGSFGATSTDLALVDISCFESTHRGCRCGFSWVTSTNLLVYSSATGRAQLVATLRPTMPVGCRTQPGAPPTAAHAHPVFSGTPLISGTSITTVSTCRFPTSYPSTPTKAPTGDWTVTNRWVRFGRIFTVSTSGFSTLSVPTFGSITGTVTSVDGKPLETVCVTTAGTHPHATRTSSQGTYSLSGIPTGSTKVMFSTCDDGPYVGVTYPNWTGIFGTGRTATLTVTANATVSGTDVTLPVGATLAGRIMATKGHLPPHGYVELEPLQHPTANPAHDALGRTGTFHTGVLPEGRYVLALFLTTRHFARPIFSGDTTARSDARVLTLRSGEHVDNYTLAVSPKSAS